MSQPSSFTPPFKFPRGKSELEMVQEFLSSQDQSQLKGLLFHLVAYPLAFLYLSSFLREKSPLARSYFTLIASCTLYLLFFPWYHFVVWMSLALPGYAVAKWSKTSLGPMLFFIYSMVLMLTSHLYRQYVTDGGESFDHTASQMMMTLKITAFVWSAFDGRSNSQTLSRYQKEKAITTLPGLVDYMGFVVFFPTILAGPSIEYSDYRDFLTLDMFKPKARPDSNQKDSLSEKKSNSQEEAGMGAEIQDAEEKREDEGYEEGLGMGEENPLEESRLIPALERLGLSLLFLFGYLVISRNVTVESYLRKEVLESSFLMRFLYWQWLAFVTRWKYYAIWTLSAGICVAAGIGWNGYNLFHDPKWNRYDNVDIQSYERSDNMKDLLESWNKCTNRWLKYYVYLRISGQGKKPTFLALLGTFMTSAIWHGAYPGYYLTFITGALFNPLSKAFHTKLGLRGKWGWLLTHCMLHYIVAPFVALNWSESLQVWGSLYYFGHIIILLGFGWLYMQKWFRSKNKSLESNKLKKEN